MSLRKDGNYDNYAFSKVLDIERRAWVEVDRLKATGATDADIERAKLRAESWTDLIHTFLKGRKIEDGTD